MTNVSDHLPARLRSSREQRTQAPAGVTLKFAKRQTVFHAGDPANYFYEVLTGTLMIFKMLSDGRRQIVEIVPPGWLSGFAKDNCYDGTCEALTDATVIAHARDAMESSDVLRRRLLQQAEEQFCTLHDQALSLGRKSAEERVSTFLMRFMPARGKQDCAGPRAPKDDAALHIPLSRSEIGDYLGLTIETVSRTVTALSKKGLIEVGPNHGDIYIRDVCNLCAAARTGRNE